MNYSFWHIDMHQHPSNVINSFSRDLNGHTRKKEIKNVKIFWH